MAINFIYGPPGGGKTYYAVNHLLNNFFIHDKKTDSYAPKEQVKIVTNIDQFKPDHIDLIRAIDKVGGANRFFSYDMQEQLHNKHGALIYMIDECHEYFPSNLKDNEIFRWFAYHRHWGQTIYLMSQSLSSIPRRITDMLELSVYAMPRSSSLLGGKDLKYNIMAGREIVDRKALIKNKRIFEQYRSQHANAKEKTRNPLLKYIVGCGVISLFLIGNAIRWASGFGEHDAAPQVTPSRIEQEKHHTEAPIRSGQDQIEVEIDNLVPVSLSWASFSDETVIFYKNKMYSIKDFPYQVTTTALGDIIALIPESKTDKEQKTTPTPASGSALASDSSRWPSRYKMN